jgi:hypothetical protein
MVLGDPMLRSQDARVNELTRQLSEVSALLAAKKQSAASLDAAGPILSRAIEQSRKAGSLLSHGGATDARRDGEVRGLLRQTETRIRVLRILIGTPPLGGRAAANAGGTKEDRAARLKELHRIEGTEIPKLEQTMFDKERVGKETMDAGELIKEARKAAGELRAVLAGDAWPRLSGTLDLLLKAARASLNGAQLKPGVTEKEIREKERKVDEATGCEAYRDDFDMYAVCKKRGLPTRRSSHGGFAYRPMDQEIASAPLPQECRDASGQPKWNGAPEVIEWVYCDNLNSGCEYYLFVQRFTSLDDLRLKDTLTAEDKIRAFVQACRQETFAGAHELAYVGTYPLSSQEFLDVLFGTQAAARPRDAFGFDGMRRQGLALAPPSPFKLDSCLFDTSLEPVVRKLNAVIREFETFRNTLMTESNELAELEHAAALTPAERDRKTELARRRDVLFIKTFNEEHAKGVIRDHKPSNASAADALKKALPVYPPGDAQRERFQELEQRLREALREFDAGIDAAVTSLSRGRPEAELVYHPGDTLFLFLKGTGSTAPKLRMTLSIKQLTGQAGASASSEQQLGVVTRAFDDPPETNRQQSIVFAIDYQQYWVSFFTQPFLIADVSSVPGATQGVVQNRAMVLEAPGEYTASIELFDETTRSRARTDLRFSVVPNRAVSSNGGSN